MELEVAKMFFGLDGAGTGHDFHVAVFHFPTGGLLVGFLEVCQIAAVKENQSVARRRREMREGVSGRHNARLRPIAVVNSPFLTGNQWRVRVTEFWFFLVLIGHNVVKG